MQILFRYIDFAAFKGGKPVHMDFADGINTIVGANGSGKSTILDALIWCLFGKDFINRTKFPMIPLNPDGSVQQVSPSVTLEIIVDGELFKLSRRMDGSKTSTEINDAPCKTLEEYNKFIARLFGDEQRFKMFTMPLYFTESLTWQEQRALLMKFFHDPDPVAVFDRMKSEKIRFGSDLVSAMKNMQPADYIAKHDKALKDVERRRDEINAQIKLLDSQLEGNQAIDQAALESERDQLRETINKINAMIVDIVESNRTILVATQKNEAIIRIAETEIDQIHFIAQNRYDREIERLKSDLNFSRSHKAQLIRDYHDRSAPVDETCPMCNQHLPAATVANAKAKQAESLKRISEQGTTIKTEIADLEKRIGEMPTVCSLIDSEVTRINELEQEIETAQGRLQSMPRAKDVPITDGTTQARLDEISRALARIDVHRENIKRKADLETEVRQLSQEYEQHTIAIAEASKFAFYRSTLVIEAVNRHFKTISVKVLEVQKNGVAKETFEITSNGVPYSGLNKTCRLASSLELMKFLKSSLQVESPVIIDDVENYPDHDLSTISGQLIVAFAKKRHPLQVLSNYPQDI